MNPIVKWVKEQAKTIAAFLGAYVANAVVGLVNGETPWPTTSAEWQQYAITMVGAAFAAYMARNKITQKQLDKDPNVVGTVYPQPVPAPVAPGPVVNPGGEYTNPYPPIS